MKFTRNHIHIGRRTLKTAAAVIISMMLVSIYGVSTSKMVFAMLGAMGVMEPSFKKSVEACLTQFVGMFFGAALGVLFLHLPLHWAVSVGIGIVLVITLYNILQIRFSPTLPCLIIVTMCITPDIQPLAYAAGRLWDTAIGLLVGLLINVLVLPYDNSMKIRKNIEYLEREVIVFLEEMFDGDKEYPNTKKAIDTIDTMAGQLSIFSEQWIPLRKKRNEKRLEVLQECEGKSRQLLARMEVLSRVKMPGRLNDENRERLKACGAKISDKGKMEELKEIDIITNYHVKQILNLRQELIDELAQFPMKGKKQNLKN